MSYVRRKPYATSFAWPPTREELDLIEVVDADTLRPIHARCDDPEPQPPEPPVLLKSVTPVRLIVRPESTPELPALLLPPDPRPAVPPPVPTLPRASWTWLSTHFDPNWLIATGAIVAVSLSGYLSLRAAPSISASDLDATAGAPSRPGAHLTVPRVIPFALNWSMPMSAPASQPPAMTPKASKTATAATPSRVRLHTPPPPKATAAATRSAQPAQFAPSAPQRQPSLQRPSPATGTVSPLALNTWRSPFLSNLIASMPSAPAAAVPTLRPVSETHAAPKPPLQSAPRATTLPTRSTDAARESTRSAPAPPVQSASRPTAGSPGLPSEPPPAAAAATARMDAAALFVPSSPSERARSAAPSAGSEAAHNAPTPTSTVASARTDAATAHPLAAPASAVVTHTQQASQQQIYAALKEYERAYGQLDAKAVRAVWPSVDTRALERAFHDLKSQTLVFDRCDIDVARGSQAVAACRGRATYETRAGQQAARSEPREWTFTLQKSDEAWRIVSASAR